MNSDSHAAKISHYKEEESLMAETLLKIRRSNSTTKMDTPGPLIRLAPRPRFLSHDAAAMPDSPQPSSVPGQPPNSSLTAPSAGYFANGMPIDQHLPSLSASTSIVADASLSAVAAGHAAVLHLLNATSRQTADVSPRATLANNGAFPIASHPSVLVHGLTSSIAAQATSYERSERPNITREEQIRKEEVEKALLSKPQRGRRRDNLSNSERLELARTRNREHAKSTRIRKKARVQELEEMEKQHKMLVTKEHISQKRREIVVDFLKLRESMIRNLMFSNSCVENVEGRQDVDEEPGKLQDLVEDVSTFIFRDSTAQDEETDAIARMRNVDQRIVSLVRNKFGQQPSQPITYVLKESMDDIALTLHDVAMLEMKLVLSGPLDIKLLSAFVRLQFAPESVKIRSVVFNVMDNALQDGHFDNLHVQVSHPSVVSLDTDRERVRDHHVLAGGTDYMDETTWPGMNI
jgi:hypothetical protein